MDGDRPRDASDATAPGVARGRRRPPAWTDAIPAEINWDDPLEVAAKLGPNAVAISLVQVLQAVGVPPLKRAMVVAQLAGQLPGLIDKRRLWEAERRIRGEAEEMLEKGDGPKLEAMPDATKAEAVTTTGRTKTLRGRPRKRSLL